MLKEKLDVALVVSSTTLWESHHADTLEMLYRLSNDGKKVFFISCDGELSSCAPNPYHNLKKCSLCRKITSYTEKHLLPKNVEFLRLRLTQYDNHDLYPNNLNELLELKYEEMPVGALVASQVASDIQGAYIDLADKDLRSRVKILVKNAIALYLTVKEIIYQYNINEVYVWNGRRPSDGPALYAAASLNKKYFCYISGGKYGYLHISESFSVHDQQKIKENIQKLDDSSDQESLAKIGRQYFSDYINGSLKQVGYVQFRKAQLANKPLDAKIYQSNKPILLVVTSSPQELIHTREYLDFYGSDPFGVMFSLVDNSDVLDKYTIILRWHPAKRKSALNDQRKIKEIISRNQSIIHFEPCSDVDTYDLLDICDVVLSFGSTVGYVAALKSKPVVLVGPASYFFSSSSLYLATTIHEGINILKKDLCALPTHEIEIFGYYLENFGSPMSHIKQIPKDNGSIVCYLKRFSGEREIYISIHPKYTLLKERIVSFLQKVITKLFRYEDKKLYRFRN